MMNRDRRLSNRNLTIKALFRDLVELAGGVTRAADKTCVNASRVSNYCSPNDPAMPPADVILDLEFDVGEPIVTRALADLAGFAIVPKCHGNQGTDFTRHLGGVAGGAGEALAKLGAAVADGTVTPKEAHDCLPAVDLLEERIACLKQDLKVVVASGVVPLRRNA